MRRRLLATLFLLFPLHSYAWQQRLVKISALADGRILINREEVDLPTLEKILAQLKKDEGLIWYYRENPSQAPHPQNMEVIKLIVKYSLPVSMSTRPDFSDYVDESGQSRAR